MPFKLAMYYIWMQNVAYKRYYIDSYASPI